MPDEFDGEADYRKNVFDALSKYHTEDAIPSDAESLQAMLDKESHRGLVIILGSYIEDALVERICRKLSNGEELRKTLKNGPLRNFEHRVTLARATGVITSRLADVLTIFRHLRNECAHCRRDISFETPVLREAFLTMLPGQSRKILKDNPELCASSFIMCASRMIMTLEDATDEEMNAARDRVIQKMQEDGRPAEFQTEFLLFEALQKRQTSKSSPDPRPRSNG
jgi:hypothetical protein